MKCPRCGADCERDEVDVGIGTIAGGPWGCFECHWVEGEPAECPDCGRDLGGSFPKCIDCQLVDALKAGK